MSAFAVSRLNVGFFGFISGESIALFPSNSLCNTENDLYRKPHVLRCTDTFVVKQESECSSKSDVETIILCAAISNCGSFVTASDNNKKFYIWRKSDSRWEATSCRNLARKAYKLLFTNSGSEVIVADRSGDVYSFSVGSISEPCKLILGHICIILDVIMTKNDRYIITCDRDCKIRVSMYPNCYNIATYCFGHDEFVSSLDFLNSTSDEVLVSGSGDGTLRLWKYQEGLEIFKCFVNESKFNSVNQDSSEQTLPATEVLKEKCAVRAIKYSPLLNVVAVLFHPDPAIGIYGTTQMNALVPLQLLKCVTTPLDAIFDFSGNLWVCTLSETQCVQLFKNVKEDGIWFVEIQKEETPESSILSELKENWPHKTLQTFELDMTHLYKNCYDSADDEKSRHKKFKLEDGIKT